MNIRDANTNDLAIIHKFNEGEVPNVNSIRRKDFLNFLKIASNFVVIESNGEIAGFMITLREAAEYKSLNYQFFSNHYKEFEYVDRIVINEKFQGRGLGRKLYDFLFENSEAELLCCEVNMKPQNPGSMAFHQKLGFNEKSKLITEDGAKVVSLLIKRI